MVVVARDRETREREGESAAVAVAMCNEIRVPTFSAHATINTTAERGVAVATGSDGPEATRSPDDDDDDDDDDNNNIIAIYDGK